MNFIEGEGINIAKFRQALKRGGEVTVPRKFQSLATLLAQDYVCMNSFFDSAVIKANFSIKFV